MQKRVLIFVFWMIFDLQSAQPSSTLLRRGYLGARNFFNNSRTLSMPQRYASSSQADRTTLSPLNQKLLERIDVAHEQGDKETVEATIKFIRSTDPRSPLLDIINEKINLSARNPEENLSSKNSEEQELDILLKYFEKDSLAALFNNPKVSMMPQIREAHERAEKALIISKNIDKNRSSLNVKALTGLRNAENIKTLIDQLGAVHSGLSYIERYRNGIYKKESLGDALKFMLNDIKPLLVLLDNPEADRSAIKNLSVDLYGMYEIAKALEVSFDFKRSHNLVSQDLFLVFPKNMNSSSISELSIRAYRVEKGLNLSQGESVITAFEKKKLHLRDIFNIFDNNNITLNDIKEAYSKVDNLLSLAEAVDAVKNRDMSKDTGNILSLWSRLSYMRSSLEELKGKDFYEFIAGERSDITRLVTDIVPVNS